VSADITIVNATLGGETVGLRATGGLIEEVGPGVGEGVAATPSAQAGPDGTGDRRLLDAGGKVLAPPLVNGHTHAAMTLFRGHGDDLPLMRWLQEAIWPVEANLDDKDVYWGTRLACLEMIRTGTTDFWDMYWQPVAVARAVEDAGIRATVGPPLLDPTSADGVGARDRTIVEQLDRLAACGPRIRTAVAPHSIYTVSTGGLEFATSVARERGLPIEIHLSETLPEVEDCVKDHGLRPAFYLDRIGMLGEQTLLAHGVYLDEDELELIAERGATVVSNPVANMKLAVGGVFPYPAAARAGVQLGLGTDGPGSNNSLDLFADLKAFALAQRHAAADAEAIPVAEALAIVTGRRSPLLGDPDPLSPGKPADFLLLDPDSLELALGDLTSNLVYTASGAVVSTTVVDGHVLMEDRRIEAADEIVAKARERAARLGLA
jgi:5-methylthioadenosine/S-adenosylhomocysteine deaminase